MLLPSRLQGNAPTASSADPSSTVAHCCCNFCTVNSLKREPSEHPEAPKHQGGGPSPSTNSLQSCEPSGPAAPSASTALSLLASPASASTPNILLAQQHHSCCHTQSQGMCQSNYGEDPQGTPSCTALGSSCRGTHTQKPSQQGPEPPVPCHLV